MPLPTLSFRTTGTWGIGLGRRLTAAEVDGNFYSVGLAIQDLQDNPPTAVSISSITADGKNMTVHLTDGTPLGPFPLPVLEFHWRGSWIAFAIYKVMDVFMVEGRGIYSVLIDHTAGASFDELLMSGGDPVYKKLFGADAGAETAANIYDVEIFYQGKPGDSAEATIIDISSLRALMLPIADVHIASLIEPPSTVAQSFPIYHNATHIGDIAFAIGVQTGTFSWLITSDEAIAKGEHLTIRQSASADATAAGLLVAFAMQRVT